MAGTDLPEQPVTFGIRITDKSNTPVSTAAYELVLCGRDQKQYNLEHFNLCD